MKASIKNMLEGVLAREPVSINTDWDGALLITALLAWGKETGDPKYGEFAKKWFAYHRDEDYKLTDEHFYAGYIGIKSRIIRQGPVPFTAYCGHWGMVYTCPGLSEVTSDPAVREVADAIASFILHTASRSQFGTAYHDDDADFAIPDTCYFASPILAIAARLTGKDVYMEHAVHQLRSFTDLFLDQETGLAYTLWSREGKPRKFWSRATGWLAGALTNTLEYMATSHPQYEKFAEALRQMARGIAAVQRPDGGFHLLLDQDTTPVDCTAPSMVALALHKGVKLGILDKSYEEVAKRAWEASASFVTPEGRPTQAYTGWAKPAIGDGFGPDNFDRPRDFVIGLILLAAASFETSNQEEKVGLS